jgi:hypothetical protein
MWLVSGTAVTRELMTESPGALGRLPARMVIASGDALFSFGATVWSNTSLVGSCSAAIAAAL